MKQLTRNLDFLNIRTWIFDLDNTLYSASCNLFVQIDARMTDFVQKLLGIDYETARKIQKDFYRDYGTTLKGLMDCYQIDPDEFLEHVHDIDYSWLEPDPRLITALSKLEGEKMIFTNGSRKHAQNALDRLGLSSLFREVFDIKDADYIPKPERDPYEQFLRLFNIDPLTSVMFEDLSRNLEAPKTLGMRTVLVVPPTSKQQASYPVDFVTSDLSTFLSSLVRS